jgi:hypothetical protein
MSWLTQGAGSAKALQAEKAKQEARANEQGRLQRFWLKPGEEARITFVDGVLATEGMNKDCLTFASYYEHHLQINGQWGNYFVCTQSENSKCPICEEDNRASFVGALTVIDHREIKSRDGTKVYKDQKKLFIASSNTLMVLQQLAAKRKGLVGCTFDVYRTSKTDARVGSTFDFIERNSLEDLQEQFKIKNEQGKEVTYFTPADYEKELPFKSEEDLRAMGFGTASIGKEPAIAPEAEDTTDYSGDL